MAAAFHADHHRLYGHSSPEAAVALMALRLRVRGRLPGPTGIAVTTTAAPPTPPRRQARFEGAWHDTPVFDWDTLPAGWHSPGPAIVQQETATVVVPPIFTASLGTYGDLILERA
jgi:N-methylhydantoinase A